MDELSPDANAKTEKKEKKTPQQIKADRVRHRVERNKYKKRCFQGNEAVADKFEDEDMVLMRKPFSEEFYQTFARGFTYYVEGKWEDARDIFEQSEKLQGDFPSQTLYQVMENENFEAPADWNGVREFKD